ncbi:MAG: leucine-rich repeat domain-containing protein [Bacteroidota bacterium]
MKIVNSKLIFFFFLSSLWGATGFSHLKTGCLFAQMLDSASLANSLVFTSLEEALQNPEKVYRLNLRKKKLKIFPVDILKFINLQELNLSKNRLKELPKELGEFSNLQILNVSCNKLSNLPNSIGKLKNLKKIIAFKNNLTSLPIQIGELEKLEVLDIWSNDIEFFPDELAKLKNLKFFDLRVILLNDEEQERIREMLPNTKIYFSPSCKCATGG